MPTGGLFQDRALAVPALRGARGPFVTYACSARMTSAPPACMSNPLSSARSRALTSFADNSWSSASAVPKPKFGLHPPRPEPELRGDLTGPAERCRGGSRIAEPSQPSDDAQRLTQHFGMLVDLGPLDCTVRVIDGDVDPSGSVSSLSEQH